MTSIGLEIVQLSSVRHARIADSPPPEIEVTIAGGRVAIIEVHR